MRELKRIAIGTWPTRVRRLDAVSQTLGAEVWAKLEDDCGTWGGNKVRKLEYILASAQADRVRRLVSFGAGTSNWTTALAFHGRAHGFEVEARLSGNETPAEYEALYDRTGTRVVRTSDARALIEVTAAHLRSDRSGSRYLPLGGSGDVGDVGSVHAGVEVADAVNEKELPRPRRIFVATGTAGTSAGLAIGTALGGLTVPIVCVRVTSLPYGTVWMVRRTIARTHRRLGLTDAVASPLIGDSRFMAPGYALPNPASEEATELAATDGLALDGTYAAKAFAALVDAARRKLAGPYLFVDTSPGPPPIGEPGTI